MKLALAARLFCGCILVNSFNQLIPIFKEFRLHLRQKSQQTVSRVIETYFRQINSEVTEYQTIQQYLYYLQCLAEQANMPFVNITLGANNVYLVTWNDPKQFDKVIIHLGSFHFLKQSFQIRK